MSRRSPGVFLSLCICLVRTVGQCWSISLKAQRRLPSSGQPGEFGTLRLLVVYISWSLFTRLGYQRFLLRRLFQFQMLEEHWFSWISDGIEYWSLTWWPSSLVLAPEPLKFGGFFLYSPPPPQFSYQDHGTLRDKLVGLRCPKSIRSRETLVLPGFCNSGHALLVLTLSLLSHRYQKQ